MSRYDRRRFLERLGLTAGSVVLPAIADQLVSRAYGQPTATKRAVFWVAGGGMQIEQHDNDLGVTPREINQRWQVPELSSTTAFSWPRVLQPLAAIKDRVVILDNLNNRVPGTDAHKAGYAVMSCAPAVTEPTGGRPGAITIDQAVAAVIGKDTAMSSILVGLNNSSIERQLERVGNTFALGPDRPLAHICKVDVVRRELFGAQLGPAGGSSSPKPVLDSLRTDIRRLEARLASTERGALGDYLSAIEKYEQQQSARSRTSCQAPALAAGATAEAVTQAMVRAVTVALQCGVTRVAGFAIGTGFEHEDMPAHPGVTATAGRLDGHSTARDYAADWGAIRQFHFTLLAEMHKALGDDTVLVYLPDTGAATPNAGRPGFTHHSTSWRYPAVVIGTAGGALRAGGRYLRFGGKRLDAPAPDNARSLGDLFLTVANAVGAPLRTFGNNAEVPNKGPIRELMA
jgi:hypothetical protein